MVQVQSSWFPLYDRNPQTFVPNIFWAKPGDYRKAVQRVFHAPGQASFVELPVVKSSLIRAGVESRRQIIKAINAASTAAPTSTARAKLQTAMAAAAPRRGSVRAGTRRPRPRGTRRSRPAPALPLQALFPASS